MEDKKFYWENPMLDLVKAFEAGNFSILNEYAEENTLKLMQGYLKCDEEGTRRTLKLATSILHHFECTLQKYDEISFTAFKLGELSGHVNSLNIITYENDADSLVMRQFVLSRSVLTDVAEPCLKAILSLIAKNSEISTSKIHDKFPLGLDNIEKVLHVFELCGFVNACKTIREVYYSITDEGRRLVKQFET